MAPAVIARGDDVMWTSGLVFGKAQVGFISCISVYSQGRVIAIVSFSSLHICFLCLISNILLIGCGHEPKAYSTQASSS